MALDARVSRDLRLGASATWLDTENRETGGRLTSAPDITASLRATWQLIPAWSVTGALVHVGKRYEDVANIASADPYTLINLGTSYAHPSWPGVQVYAGIDNLFAAKNDTSLYADPGRFFRAGARWFF